MCTVRGATGEQHQDEDPRQSWSIPTTVPPMTTVYTPRQQRVRWTFATVGTVLVLSMGAVVVVSLSNNAGLFVPFAVVLGLLGVYYLCAGLSGYVARDADAVSDDNSGSILAVGLVFSLTIPVIGLVVGIGLLFRRTAYGALLMVTSIVSSLVWYAVLFR